MHTNRRASNSDAFLPYELIGAVLGGIIFKKFQQAYHRIDLY